MDYSNKKRFQICFKYGTEMTNFLNYNIPNNYFYTSVGIENGNNKTWFEEDFIFPEDIVEGIKLGLFKKVYK